MTFQMLGFCVAPVSDLIEATYSLESFFLVDVMDSSDKGKAVVGKEIVDGGIAFESFSVLIMWLVMDETMQ